VTFSADVRRAARPWEDYPGHPWRMRDHTSLLAWQVSMDLSVEVYKVSVARWRPAAKAAFDQLGRASLSVPLNISEGYTWRPGKRWLFHLRVALGSAVETTDVLRFLGVVAVLSESELGPLERESRRAQALVLLGPTRYGGRGGGSKPYQGGKP